MTDEEIEKLKDNMKHMNVWKITADPDFKEDPDQWHSINPCSTNLFSMESFS